ncbi:MAG: hypothetical protein KJO12_05730 [Ignavibacteria bacterium]|nr:hypothetical protein [Ignavibacteria bacterium]
MKTTTNTFVLATVALFALLVSFGCADVSVNPLADIKGSGVIADNKYKALESFSYNVDLTNQNTLKVEGINGEVNVRSVSGTNQVTISGEKVVSSDTYQDAFSHLKNIAIEINELTNELLVKTLQPQFSDGRSYQVNYTINIPSHLSVIVRNVNGKIDGRVSVPLNGTVDMSLQNGRIELDIPQNTSADFSASLFNGSISFQNLTLHNRVATSKSLQGRLREGQGTITLRTTNGNIDVLGF